MDDFERIRAVLLRERVPPMMGRQHLPAELGYDQLINNRGRGRIYRYQGPMPPRVPSPAMRGEPRLQRMKVEDDVLSYSGGAGDQVGLYVAARTMDYYNNYFEIEIIDIGDLGQICVGVVPEKYPLNCQPGIEPNAVGYMAENGKFNVNHGRGNIDTSQTGPPCGMGDRMGVGIRLVDDPAGGDRLSTRVFFTKNGQEVKSFDVTMWPHQLFPAVGMQSEGEEVVLRLDAVWNPDDVTQMVVDCEEEDWIRLDDIRLNGTVLEYTGRGRTIHDVGLAQAKYPLDTTNHYFEFEIVDPGDKCYVAIGLARQNYPMRRHPGWNIGSIAYHADDGKLFHGSGMGVRFGPKCSKGDIMGCGIYFPPDYDSEADVLSNDEEDDPKGLDEDEDIEDDDEEGHVDEFWGVRGGDSDEDNDVIVRPPKRFHHKGKGTKVTVFFTRNGKVVGHKQVQVPKGGFYPTIGMLSCNEKVRVDLRPLTG